MPSEAQRAADALRQMQARQASLKANPPIFVGMDFADGESWTVWHASTPAGRSHWVRDLFEAGQVHAAGAITLEQLAPGVWGRRV